MAVYRQVHISFWQDPFILELTPEEKYFYLYLMTNSKTRQCGCYEISKRVMQVETGYNSETIDKLLSRFIEYQKIHYSEETKEVLLVNWLKFNSHKSPRVKQCIRNEIKEIKNKKFAKFVTENCNIDYVKTIHTEPQKEKEKEEEEEQKEGSRGGKNIPPQLQEVIDYCKERGNNVDADKFCDFYESKNWYVGKNKMKNWQAAVRTWEKSSNDGKSEYKDLTNAYKE